MCIVTPPGGFRGSEVSAWDAEREDAQYTRKRISELELIHETWVCVNPGTTMMVCDN